MTEIKYVSERIWWGTNLPERGNSKDTLKELKEIERSVDQIPDWAVSIAENNINYFPPCGHEMFEHNVNAILEAIEEQREVKNFYYCFMVSDDALANAQQLEEKCRRSKSGTCYTAVLADRLRWWASVNSEITGNPFTDDGEHRDYYEWDKKTENTIARSDLSPDDELVNKIKNTWLCAPKAFRFIEKIGTEIDVNLRGFDTYSKHSFRTTIADSMKQIESAISSAEKDGNSIARFLLVLLKAKLNEYMQNGTLKKVLRT